MFGVPVGKQPYLSLRELEKLVGKDMESRLDPLGKKITVNELIARYLKTKMKNPFGFELVGVIINTEHTREAVTREQMNKFLKFVHDDNVYYKYYDVFYILSTSI